MIPVAHAPTRHLVNGVPLSVLQAWMGHEKIDTAMIYAHYAPILREAPQIGAVFDAVDPGACRLWRGRGVRGTQLDGLVDITSRRLR